VPESWCGAALYQDFMQTISHQAHQQAFDRLFK
jgi:hypothetical protein